MSQHVIDPEAYEPEYSDAASEACDPAGISRRTFVEFLGAGVLITVTARTVAAQRGGGKRGGARGSSGQRGGGPRSLASRVHIDRDGAVTVLTGKVEMGQGSRAELTQAAAEELRVAPEKLRLIMGDTALVPDDGTTAGSATTPRTVPAVRQAAAAARQLLVELAAKRWQVEPKTLEVRDGTIAQSGTDRTMTYAELAKAEDLAKALAGAAPSDVTVTPVKEWKVLGTSFARPNRRDLVTGAHKFPSDLVRPGMLRGKVLRPPSYGAKLVSIDLGPAKAMKDVVAVQDGQFVGVAAPTAYQAQQALDAIAPTAKWEPAPHPSSKEVFDYLRKQARGVPQNSFADELAAAAKVLKQTYHVPYVQHAPLETRTALAEWSDGKLTVWTGTQAPFGYHGQLAGAFGLPNQSVRVIVPDFGSGFGGKHTAEAAIEAARLARAAGRPVLLHWTREEEFTWAYFRPAAVIDVEASLDAKGRLTSWHFININSGGAAVQTPYQTGKSNCRTISSNTPLRQGSYRTLAAPANNFARECFMDELAAAAGVGPLEFRLAHLENPRLRAVLEEAARRFNWREKVKEKRPDVGVGLACGTEKGSYVAACVEIAIDRSQQDRIVVRRVCEVFECGAVLNPDNLTAQVAGCIIMGLGPALREEMRFDGGKMRNASFERYLVPRFSDVPELDMHLLNRPDLPSAGGGETPNISIAPAIANAVFHATGKRVHSLPIRASG